LIVYNNQKITDVSFSVHQQLIGSFPDVHLYETGNVKSSEKLHHRIEIIKWQCPAKDAGTCHNCLGHNNLLTQRPQRRNIGKCVSVKLLDVANDAPLEPTSRRGRDTSPMQLKST